MKSQRAEGLPPRFRIDPRDGRFRSRLIQVVMTLAGCALAAVLIMALMR